MPQGHLLISCDPLISPRTFSFCFCLTCFFNIPQLDWNQFRSQFNPNLMQPMWWQLPQARAPFTKGSYALFFFKGFFPLTLPNAHSSFMFLFLHHFWESTNTQDCLGFFFHLAWGAFLGGQRLRRHFALLHEHWIQPGACVGNAF